MTHVPTEWTLEQAKKCWNPMVHPIMHVGVPGYQFQTGIMWDGALLFGPNSFLDLKVMDFERELLGNNLMHVSFGYGDPMRFIDRKGTLDPAIRRGLVDGRIPIPYTETTDGDLVWNETVFAHLLGRKLTDGMKPKRDDILVTHVRFTVRNTGYAKTSGHLWIHLGDQSQIRLGYKSRQGDELATSIPHSFKAPYGMMDRKVRYAIPKPAKGRMIFHAVIPAPLGMEKPGERVIEWQIPLAAGEEAELWLAIPYGLVEKATAEKILALNPEKEYSKVLDYWRELEGGPGQITTPDPFFNDYLNVVAGQMAEQVAYRHSTKVWMYKTSPNWYEGYWPCNAGKALPAFDFRGLTDINRKVLQSFIDVRTGDVAGLTRTEMGHGNEIAGEGYEVINGFMGNFGEWTANPLVLSHGLALWALAQHYRITRDDAWLKKGKVSPLQAMLDGCDWVTKQRRRTMREDNGQKVPYWGLLPAASAHDWLAGNTIFNDAFCIYGMTEVARVLRDIKHPRAKALVKEISDYRQCLHDRYVEARDKAKPLPLADGTTIPYVPRIVQELDWRGVDWTYTMLSVTRCGAWGVFEPHDELVNQGLAFLEAGDPKGEGFYFSPESKNVPTAEANWAYVADPEAERHHRWRHYVEYETMWPIGGPLFLERDDLPRFFEWLFHNMGFAVHQDFRVGTESIDGVPSNAPGDGERWMMIRRMFFSEYGGYDGSDQSLFLLQAILQSWLKPGDRMTVRDMPTLFGGQTNIGLQVAEDGSFVVAHVTLEDLAVKPKDIRMRLRSCDGRPLVSVTVNGKKAAIVDDDIVKLPPKTNAKWTVVGTFK